MSSYQLDFNPDVLPIFLAVADAQRISAAAKAVHLSQPAVTARIRNLERQLGVQLLTRSTLGVRLTPAGRVFYERAKKIYGLMDEAAFEAQKSRSPKGKLILSASTTIASHILPEIFSKFKKRNPALSFVLHVGNTEEVLEEVKQGIVALGLVEGHGRASAVALKPFLEDQIVLAGPVSPPFRPRKAKDLFKCPLLAREPGSGTRSVVERSLRKAGFPIRSFSYTAELGSTEAIKSAVSAGLGFAFLSRWAIQKEIELGQLAAFPLSDIKIKRLFYWVIPSGGIPNLYLEFFYFARKNLPIRKADSPSDK
jgi:DNA-binding transcriptional LysR family regulator